MVNRSWVGHAYARVTLSSLRPVARIALEPRLCAKEGRPKYSRRNRAADLSAWPAVSVSAPRGCLGLACNHADDYRISLVMRRVRLVIALSVAGLLMGPAHALGQPQEQPTQGGVVSTTEGPDRERAKQLYEQGLEFYRSRQYSEAIDRFLDAGHRTIDIAAKGERSVSTSEAGSLIANYAVELANTSHAYHAV